MYRDFGVGQMGDMGAHTMDLVWNVVDAGAPTAIDIDRDVGDKFNPDICPVKLKAHFTQPANSWRGPIELVWYQGGLKPDAPKGYIDISKVGNGAIFEGTKGTLQILRGDFTSATHPEWKKHAPDVIKEGPGENTPHIRNFLQCIRSRKRPNADVEIAHRSTSVCHLINIARECNRTLQWDPKAETFPHDAEANGKLERVRRKGYELPKV